MKKLTFSILFVFFLFHLSSAYATERPVLYFFWSKTCYHCHKEKKFLEKMEKKYTRLIVHYLEVSENKENKKNFELVVDRMNINTNSLPTTIIGENYFIGFLGEHSTGFNIEREIQKSLTVPVPDVVSAIIHEDAQGRVESSFQTPGHIYIPFFGKVPIKNLSLPILTILLGAVDGFNPCAMWALVMLLSFLITMENRKKLFLLGGLFILISAIVYFVFMVAWLNFLTYFAYIKWIRILIGIVALIGGLYYLKEYFINRQGTCKVTSSEFKQTVSKKIMLLTEGKKLWLAIIGISLLAFSINVVELVCSAGLPVIYTQILSLSSLSPLTHYMYILLYVFIYMLDDLIVFSIAVFSLNLIKFTSKYSRYSHLVGGIMLLFLGVLLVFRPNLLMF